MAGLTPFQRTCEEALTKALQERSLHMVGRVEQGRKETYITAGISSTALQVYIYLDEAGIQAPGQWIPFEVPDYDTASELIAAFTDEVLKLSGAASVSGA